MKKNFPFHSKIAWLIWAIIILLVMLTIAGGYEDARRHSQHEKLLDSITHLMSSIEGQGIPIRESEGCSNTDQVWGLGKNLCGIFLESTTHVSTLEEANNILKIYTRTVNDHSDFKALEQPELIKATISNVDSYKSTPYKYIPTNTSCDLSSTYSPPESNLKLSFSCNE